MKKIINVIFIAIGLLILSLFGVRYYTKSHSEFDTVIGKTGDLQVKVGYSPPIMKNRKIFGELVPYNTVWRTGANEATLVTFSKNCFMAGKSIKAGDYSLWTIPRKKNWVIILNNETGQWGTNYDENKDYLRFTIKSESSPKLTDKLTIGFKNIKNGLNMELKWENTIINIPIKD
ncbi:MAG: DUF2911 domain-containing protein [Cytophagaceae bacterium]|nr:DUF2911 domain-containing protein [Cytophagaceae bacterium]MBK9510813.1 DUF2911 domain-containing protein [Cytophagaceae bacterium]MBK9934704.1 DUF2911 domain-containing protein [Cytophagaceae bacterium]MBL0301141.1 DUF2911 domain-containing protein [Cytophagaceae bacterium]MBL0323959.1 DUF2911 domain-containing protein [Cytophagaceae bacterium]